MKKKMIAGAVLSVALVFSMSANVVASGFVGSPLLQNGSATGATITTGSGEEVQTAVGTTADLTEALSEALNELGGSFGEKDADGNTISINSIKDPIIKVTPVQETQSANAQHDEENSSLSFWEKASEYTSSGLSYSANEQTNLVYEAASVSNSTESFLSKFEGLVESATEWIKEVIAETTEAYESASDVPDEEAAVNDWSPALLVDISANDAAKELMGENGHVDVELAVDSVDENSRVLALHFMDEDEDPDALRQQLEEDPDNALVGHNVERLEATPGNGKVTIKMTNASGFSPVMILVQSTEETAETTEEENTEETTTEEAVEETAEETTVEEATAETASSQGSNVAVWVVLIVVIVAVVVVLLNRNKKGSDTKNK